MPTTLEVLIKRKSYLGTLSGGADEIAHLVTALSRAGGTLWEFDPSQRSECVGGWDGNFNHSSIAGK